MSQATEATLVINRFDSHCSACRMGVDPYATQHDRVIGYSPGTGCGAVFTSASSDYLGMKERIREMRPDLTWVGLDL